MADAPQLPHLPSWLVEAVAALSTAMATRLALLLRRERRAVMSDRRTLQADAVLAEVQRRRLRLPPVWGEEVHTAASAIVDAHMRAHEEAIRPRVEELAETRHRIASLEEDRERTALALDRLTDQLRDDRLHMDERLDRLADALTCRACPGGSR